jgi:hypothetical protein
MEIPDDVAGELSSGGDVVWFGAKRTNGGRRALEAFALDEYKSGRLTDDQLRRMPGYGTRWELDGFLKAHDVWIEYTMEDFHREMDALKRLGI